MPASTLNLIGLSLATVAAVGCGMESPAPQAAARVTGVAAAAAPAASTEVLPKIVALSPSTIAVRDGHAESGRYSVEYQITNVEKVEGAALIIWAPGVGQVQRVPFSPETEGTVTFDLDTARSDLGPTVAFRARCPAGETEWYTLGSPPLPYDEVATPVLRIAAVHPDRISLLRVIVASNGDIPAGAGEPVTIRGPLLTDSCTIEAAVNGRPVELNNLLPQKQGFRGLLMYRDIDNREVSSRYLEVKLQVQGRGFRRETIQHITFVE